MPSSILSGFFLSCSSEHTNIFSPYISYTAWNIHFFFNSLDCTEAIIINVIHFPLFSTFFLNSKLLCVLWSIYRFLYALERFPLSSVDMIRWRRRRMTGFANKWNTKFLYPELISVEKMLSLVLNSTSQQWQVEHEMLNRISSLTRNIYLKKSMISISDTWEQYKKVRRKFVMQIEEITFFLLVAYQFYASLLARPCKFHMYLAYALHL